MTSLWSQTNPVVIPLHFAPFVKGANVQNKYGIDVSINGGQSLLYEFDTGGQGFWAGYNAGWWGAYTDTGVAVTNIYSSGNVFEAFKVITTVTIGSGPGHSVTATNVTVAAITNAYDTNNGTVYAWTNSSVPPYEQNFFGDFGAAPSVNGNNGMSTLLAAMPGSLTNGYIVSLGPIGSSNSTLTVGLTDQLRAAFPYVIPMTIDPGVFFPSGAQAYEQFPFEADFTLTYGTNVVTFDNWPTIFDSGAPSTSIRTNAIPAFSSNGTDLNVGTIFSVTFPSTNGVTPLTFSYVAGTNGSVNLVEFDTGALSTGDVNTGLNIYNYFNVMFDLEQGVIRMQAVPEPSSYGLFLCALAVLLLFRIFRSIKTVKGIRSRNKTM